MKTFRQIREAWPWQPISRCPGRFVLAKRYFCGPPSRLLGLEEDPDPVFKATRDPVFVHQLDEGGVISYRHSDGTFVHTLNTTQGLHRKLIDLGLKVPCPSTPVLPVESD